MSFFELSYSDFGLMFVRIKDVNLSSYFYTINILISEFLQSMHDPFWRRVYLDSCLYMSCLAGSCQPIYCQGLESTLAYHPVPIIPNPLILCWFCGLCLELPTLVMMSSHFYVANGCWVACNFLWIFQWCVIA